MALSKKLEKYLKKHGIDYKLVKHKTVYTAFDLAKTTGKKLADIAKTVALKADKKYMLVVVPASHRLSIPHLQKLLKSKSISIVKEVSLSKVFKVKPGAIVPFASFHSVPVYIDKQLLKNKIVLVSGGSYTESLELKTKTLLERGAEALQSFSKAYLADTKKGASRPKAKARKKTPRKR